MSEFDMDIVWTGAVNGAPVSMKGALTRSGDSTLAFKGNFDAIPDTFTPAALSNSGICYQCGNGAVALGNVSAIHELTGGNNTAFRGFRISEQDGRVLGEVQVHGITRRLSAGKYVNATIVQGIYQGPTDIMELGPYIIPLEKSAPGLLEGTYKQTLKTRNGHLIFIEAFTHYKWDAAATPASSNLLMSMEYLRHSYEDKVLDFEVRASVSPSLK